MCRSTLPIVLSCLASCGVPSPKPPTELEALAALVSKLESHLGPGEARRQTAAQPAVQPAVDAARQADLPSRFAILAPGKLTMTDDERLGLAGVAASVAALAPDSAVKLILDYGKTSAGLMRAIKILDVMEPGSTAEIMKLLRTAERRTVLDQQVVHVPAGTPSSVLGDKTKRPAVSPLESGFASRPTGGQQVGRFVIAGYGQSRWQTIQDTATGIVYNYREDVDGAMRWVPITPSLLQKK